jgi:hypothetical protein
MPLIQLNIQPDEQWQSPARMQRWLDLSRQRIELYWDQFLKRPIEQYVACDFELVIRTLVACRKQRVIDGDLLVEWGCGFGVITGAASLLGFDAVGIEAEQFLCDQSVEMLTEAKIPAEIWQGNFLPPGARKLSESSDPVVSLGHHCASAYAEHSLALDDFAVVYVYPWPGEEYFLSAVFNYFARPGAILVLYRGPYHIEVYQKR